ncbi:hypothetical protein [Streptomyces sp. NPDC089915]|uniref:hypothetical protein n=1 Tax=Streptomyces sp. NPDC089915 TaxID=3155186 RepID=UPI00341C486E
MRGVKAAARAATVVIATWLGLCVLMVLVGFLLPGPRPHGPLWSAALTLWLLSLLLGPLVACVALRRWIAGSRPASPVEQPPPAPYAQARQDLPQLGGATRRTDTPPPPPPPTDEQRRSRAPRATEDPDAEVRRRAQAEAERKRAAAERARSEEARRRAARNRRIRQRGGRY